MSQLFEEILHHGYLVVGERREALETLKKRFGPAAIYESYDSFGIADSRFLKERQSRKVAAGEKRIFVLAIASITLEAQQALLKTLEEPNPNNHFFLIVASEYLLLPTLRSRFEIVRLPLPALISDEAEEFFSLAPEARLKFAADKLTEDDNKEPLFAFLNQLEVFLDETGPDGSVGAAVRRRAVEDLKHSRQFLRQRGGNVRLVLEHLALTLPRLKTHAKI